MKKMVLIWTFLIVLEATTIMAQEVVTDYEVTEVELMENLLYTEYLFESYAPRYRDDDLSVVRESKVLTEKFFEVLEDMDWDDADVFRVTFTKYGLDSQKAYIYYFMVEDDGYTVYSYWRKR
ncbi:hypothetical protein FACS1894140_1880 [Spirochaetia bacterium]|nr:hypothetical protein FACS1894140_1880 [Spirochaetia bacterium]